MYNERGVFYMLIGFLWCLLLDEPYNNKPVGYAESERRQLEATVRFVQSVRWFLTENGFIKKS